MSQKPKPAPNIKFFKAPTKAEKQAACLLLIQLETLERSPTLRKTMNITLTDLSKIDKIRRQLQAIR